MTSAAGSSAPPPAGGTTPIIVPKEQLDKLHEAAKKWVNLNLKTGKAATDDVVRNNLNTALASRKVFVGYNETGKWVVRNLSLWEKIVALFKKSKFKKEDIAKTLDSTAGPIQLKASKIFSHYLEHGVRTEETKERIETKSEEAKEKSGTFVDRDTARGSPRRLDTTSAQQQVEAANAERRRLAAEAKETAAQLAKLKAAAPQPASTAVRSGPAVTEAREKFKAIQPENEAIRARLEKRAAEIKNQLAAKGALSSALQDALGPYNTARENLRSLEDRDMKLGSEIHDCEERAMYGRPKPGDNLEKLRSEKKEVAQQLTKAYADVKQADENVQRLLTADTPKTEQKAASEQQEVKAKEAEQKDVKAQREEPDILRSSPEIQAFEREMAEARTALGELRKKAEEMPLGFQASLVLEKFIPRSETNLQTRYAALQEDVIKLNDLDKKLKNIEKILLTASLQLTPVKQDERERIQNEIDDLQQTISRSQSSVIELRNDIAFNMSKLKDEEKKRLG